MLADDAVPADDKKALVQDGKDLFEGGHFEEAILAFGAELTRTKDKIRKGQLHANIALCNLKLSKADLAIRAADMSLKEDSKNEKALFRRGCAYEMIRDTYKASKDFSATPGEGSCTCLPSTVYCQNLFLYAHSCVFLINHQGRFFCGWIFYQPGKRLNSG